MDHLMRLVSILERESELAEELLRRMVSVRLLVAAGEGRMLARAADEIDDLNERLGTTELLRELVVADVRSHCGFDPLSGDWSFGALVGELESAEMPLEQLRSVAHRLAGTVGEIAEIQPDVTALLDANVTVVRSRREQLESSAPVVTYGASGR